MKSKLMAAFGASIIFLTGLSAEAATDDRSWNLDEMINPELRDDFSKRQPIDFTDYKAVRASALYKADEAATLRKSHENPEIIKLYDEFLGKPNSHKAHELLHTSYVPRKKYMD